MSFNAELVEFEQIKLDRPVLIQGLPGIGYVGKVTVDFLIEKLKNVKVAELYSRFLTFPDGNLGITVGQDGHYTLPKYELRAYTDTSPNLILLTGDTQPQYWGQFEIASLVLDYLRRQGGDTAIAIGGYGTQVKKELSLTYAVTSDEPLIEKLQALGAERAKSGSIIGAFGVLLGVAQIRRIKCIGLLGATQGFYPDIEAAKRIIGMLTQLYGFSVDTSELDSRVTDIKQKMRQLEDIQKEMTNPEKPETVRKEPPSGYII